MSRVGKKPIPIPAGVKVKIQPGCIQVEGPKGKLSTDVPAGIHFEMKDGTLCAACDSSDSTLSAKHGLARTLVGNAVAGVTQGYKQELEVVGIGYKAEVRRGSIFLNLGYSHPIEYPIPPGIEVKVEKIVKPQVQHYQTSIFLSGIDKYLIGQTAANLRFLRPPDPYKGKGIRYAGEVIRLKEGKKGA
jgi:large subunit ribosomal protein L6